MLFKLGTQKKPEQADFGAALAVLLMQFTERCCSIRSVPRHRG
jgi:hypothetical protein